MDEKELRMQKKRLLELAETAYSQNRYTYTPFLGLAEQQVFYALQRELSYAGCALEGGAPLCERKIIRFGDPGYEEAFPIARLLICPRTPKFAESLSHRDFLGALMNLGIERDVLGDIFLTQQPKDANKERPSDRGQEAVFPVGSAVLFCRENMADYIIEHLNQVRRTAVFCERAEKEFVLSGAEPVRVSLTASSPRADGVIAKVYHLSRQDSQELFRMGRVFINGIATENVSCQLKEGDAVTVRGFGKFVFYGQSGTSRKGKERIEVGVYGV